jgi:hypothetical protein
MVRENQIVERTLMLFEMNEAMRLQVVERLGQQIAALEKERVNIIRFGEKMRSMGCPPALAPSEFFERTEANKTADKANYRG